MAAEEERIQRIFESVSLEIDDARPTTTDFWDQHVRTRECWSGPVFKTRVHAVKRFLPRLIFQEEVSSLTL